MIELLSAEDLARKLGFQGATSAFRDWCASLQIRPVPGRRGFYDPALVRRRLDEAQGLLDQPDAAPSAALSLVEQRRARRGSG